MKHLKKLFALLMVCCLGAALAGCSGSDQAKEEVDGVVNNYLEAVKAGNAELCQQYEADGYTGPLTSQSVEENADQFAVLGIDENLIDDYMVSVRKAAGQAFQSWTLKETKVDGKSASVTADVTGVGQSQIMDSGAAYESGQKLGEQWAEEHMDEVNAYLEQEPTEEELVSWMYTQLLPYLTENLVAATEELPQETTELRFLLSDDGSGWKISGIEKAADATDSQD